MSRIERNHKVLRDASCPSLCVFCWQSENICLTSALSLNRLYLMLEESVMPTAHPYCCRCCLADFCHRLQVIEELSEQTLLAWAYEHSHCPLLSTVWFRMSERLGNALLSSFIEKQTCARTKHKHDYRPSQLPWQRSIPLHSKTHCRHSKNNVCCLCCRLLSRRQPSEPILVHLKVGL